jgi:hypothetical protein
MGTDALRNPEDLEVELHPNNAFESGRTAMRRRAAQRELIYGLGNSRGPGISKTTERTECTAVFWQLEGCKTGM